MIYCAHGKSVPDEAAGVRGANCLIDFTRPEGEKVRAGKFACIYGQTSSGAVAIQSLTLESVE